MNSSFNKLYAFRSIALLTVGAAPLQEELRSRSPWMLIVIAGTGIARIKSENETVRHLAPGSALLGDMDSGAAGMDLHADNGDWKLYYIEFIAISLPHENEMSDGREVSEL